MSRLKDRLIARPALASWLLGSLILAAASNALAAPVPTVTLTAAPAFLAYGATSTLTWSSTGATSCSASGAWSGTKATSGNQTTAALTVDVAYRLTCTGPGGSKTASAFINIKPTLTLSAAPTSVASGGTSKLTWSAARATSCVASGAWTGTKAMSGTQTTGALTSTGNYTLTCKGSGGSVAKTATVTVTVSSAPTATLTASPTSVNSGASSQLTWSSTNATSCAAAGAWSGAKGTSGTQSTGALTANSSFTLTCAGAGGNVARTATVNVTAGAPSVSLAANPRGVARNGSSTLTWAGTNVTTCTASSGWTGTKAISGSQSIGPLTQDSTYSLSCSGSRGNAVAMTTVSLREAALSWQAPTKNVDGSNASLSGYRIYYGTASKNYTQSLAVTGASTLQRTIAVSPGTWYFAISAVDTSGAESAKSGEVSKVVQ